MDGLLYCVDCAYDKLRASTPTDSQLYNVDMTIDDWNNEKELMYIDDLASLFDVEEWED